MGVVGALCRSTFRRRWRGLLVIALITAGAVGFTLSAANGARRSATAFDRLVARTDTASILGSTTAEDIDPLLADLRARPEIRVAAAFSYFPTYPEGRDPNGFGMFAGIGPGFGETIIRPVILEGRRANPARADEITINRAYADKADLQVGDDTRLLGPFGISQDVTIVGIHLTPLDVGANGSQPSANGTPAFGKRWAPVILASEFGQALRPTLLVRLVAGAGSDALPAEILLRHPDSTFVSNPFGGDIDSGLQAEANAFLALCAGAGLAALTILLLLAGRELAKTVDDDQALRAMGIEPKSLTVAALVPVATAVAAGLVIAPVVAVLSSPLVHAGVAAQADPVTGVWFDGSVLAVGGLTAALLLGLGLLIAQWIVRRVDGSAVFNGGSSRSIRWASLFPAAGIGVATVAAGASPIRRLLRITVIALIVFGTGLIASLTWVESANTLASTPRNQGWAFDAAVERSVDSGSIEDVEATLLDRSDVVGLARYDRTAAPIGGADVDIFAITPLRGSTYPTMRSGRLPTGPMEVVLGPRTLARLDIAVGQLITVDGANGLTQLSVVGEAIFPILGNGNFGDAASMSLETLQALGGEVQLSGVLISLAAGTDPTSLRASIGETDLLVIPGVSPLPSEIAHLVEATPIVRTLVWFYVGLCVVALASGVLSASRRRSREVAVLRAVGFRPRQVIASSIWLTGILAVVAAGFSLVLGTLAGRALWQSSAGDIPVLDSSTTPVTALLLLMLGLAATVTAVGVGAAWRPARTSVAAQLRTI